MDKNILNVNLHLSVSGVSGEHNGVGLKVERISSDWDEHKLSYMTGVQNAAIGPAQYSILEPEDVDFSVSVTELVKTAIEEGLKEIAFHIFGKTLDSTYVTFISKEGSEEKAPELRFYIN